MESSKLSAERRARTNAKLFVYINYYLIIYLERTKKQRHARGGSSDFDFRLYLYYIFTSTKRPGV